MCGEFCVLDFKRKSYYVISLYLNIDVYWRKTIMLTYLFEAFLKVFIDNFGRN